MLEVLLPTKLYVPQIRPFIVPRPHLVEKLNRGLGQGQEGFSGRLSLVSAPAGFGKTTLVVEWATLLRAAADISVCWLSLDEQDNVPARFLAYLAAALQCVHPSLGEGLLAMTQAPQLPPPKP